MLSSNAHRRAQHHHSNGLREEPSAPVRATTSRELARNAYQTDLLQL
jgi:hypothetical protein